jgi:hypothetical protein
MSTYYFEESFVYPKEGGKQSNEIVHGNAWKAFSTEAGHFVEYISGELAGRTKKLTITEQEYQQLAAGQITFDSLLIKYEAN